MPRDPRHVSVAVLVVLVLAGCRMDVVAEGRLDADGTGAAAMTVTLDPGMVAELDALGVDPTAEVVAAGADAGPWEITRDVGGDGSVVVEVARPTGDPGELAEAFRELTAGLDPAAPALLVDLEVDVDAEGRTVVSGQAGLRPPETVGVRVDGRAPGPDAEELAELTRRTVTPRLVLSVPGTVVEHDADRLEGTRAEWELPVGDLREVGVVTEPAGWLGGRGALVGLTAGVLLLLGAAALVVGTRMRRGGDTPLAQALGRVWTRTTSPGSDPVRPPDGE